MINLLAGLLLVPIILYFLGAEQFAAWALYSSGGMAFTTLEFGIARTLVRFLAVPMAKGHSGEVDAVATSGTLITAAVYGGSLLLCLPWIGSLTEWLGLPAGTAVGAETMFMLVIAAVALRAILGLGGVFLYAAQDFHSSAALAFLQPFLSNLAAMGAAVVWRRLDLVLLCYWVVQLAVVGAALLVSWSRYRWRLAMSSLSRDTLRTMIAHALKVQMAVWAQAMNFHFDKFMIAGFIGLEAVAPYEIASRALLSLRSVPASGIETFLPATSVGHGRTRQAWGEYQRMGAIAGSAVLFFIVAPLMTGPLFLYAWIGVPGIAAWDVIWILALGVTVELLALPAVTWLQAEGRAELYARTSVLSVTINIPASLGLLYLWGVPGAAAGTALAMVVAHLNFLRLFHRTWPAEYRQPLGELLRVAFVPVALCLGWGLVATLAFDQLLSESPWTRLRMAAASGILYGGCILTLVWVILPRMDRGPSR